MAQCYKVAAATHVTHPIFILSFLCLGIALVTTFAPPPVGVNNGRGGSECADHDGVMAVCICPRITVCAKKWYSVMFLVFARASAYFDYPLYVALFLSKAHKLHEFLQRTMTSWSQTRRVNLIWMCRDPDFIEHYLHNIYDDDAWSFIFYTGKRDLNFDEEGIKFLKQTPNIILMQGRPDLEEIICCIIDNISNDIGIRGLPAGLLQRSGEYMRKIFHSSPMARFLTHLETMLATYSQRELYNQAVDLSFGVFDHESSSSDMGVRNKHGITL